MFNTLVPTFCSKSLLTTFIQKFCLNFVPLLFLKTFVHSSYSQLLWTTFVQIFSSQIMFTIILHNLFITIVHNSYQNSGLQLLFTVCSSTDVHNSCLHLLFTTYAHIFCSGPWFTISLHFLAPILHKFGCSHCLQFSSQLFLQLLFTFCSINLCAQLMLTILGFKTSVHNFCS